METQQCPKCGETIATTETTCPACKVVITDFLKMAGDVEAVNKYLQSKKPQPQPQPQAQPTQQPVTQHGKKSLLRNLPSFLKRK